VMVHGALVSDCRGLDLSVQAQRRSLLDHLCCHLEKSSSAVTAEVWCSYGALPCEVTCRSVRVMVSVAVSYVMDDLHCDSFLMMTVARRDLLHHLTLNTKIHLQRRKSLARRSGHR
jgi:hypothetical protein